MYEKALKQLLQQGSGSAGGNVNYLCHFKVRTSKAITFDQIIYDSLLYKKTGQYTFHPYDFLRP